MITHKTFRVASVSDNTNSFGLTGYVLVARTGESWQVARAIGSGNVPWHKGQDVTVPTSRIGRPTWALVNAEIPHRLVNAPLAVTEEVYPASKPTSKVQVPSYLDDQQAERAGKLIATEFGLSRAKGYTDRWQTEGGTFTNKGVARRALSRIVEGL